MLPLSCFIKWYLPARLWLEFQNFLFVCVQAYMCSELSIYAALWSSDRKSTANKTHLMRNYPKYIKWNFYVSQDTKVGSHPREQSDKGAGVREFYGGKDCIIFFCAFLSQTKRPWTHKYTLPALRSTGTSYVHANTKSNQLELVPKSDRYCQTLVLSFLGLPEWKHIPTGNKESIFYILSYFIPAGICHLQIVSRIALRDPQMDETASCDYKTMISPVNWAIFHSQITNRPSATCSKRHIPGVGGFFKWESVPSQCEQLFLNNTSIVTRASTWCLNNTLISTSPRITFPRNKYNSQLSYLTTHHLKET